MNNYGILADNFYKGQDVLDLISSIEARDEHKIEGVKVQRNEAMDKIVELNANIQIQTNETERLRHELEQTKNLLSQLQTEQEEDEHERQRLNTGEQDEPDNDVDESIE